MSTPALNSSYAMLHVYSGYTNYELIGDPVTPDNLAPTTPTDLI